MAEEAKEAEAAEGEAKPKSKKKLIIIVAGVVLLLLGAGVPLLMLGGEEKKPDHEHAEEEVKHYETVMLDTFIVNLSANSSFLKVGIMVEYDPSLMHAAEHGAEGGSAEGGGHGGGGGEASGGGLPGPMAARDPMIRDAIIRVLSSKKAEEVLTPEGKDKIKEELIEAINEAIGLEEGPVVNLYFTEFMVQ